MRYLVALLLVMLMAAVGEAAKLEGTVRDADDRPVAGARVGIATAAPLKGQGMFCPSCYLDCAKSARSDAEGRFEFSSVSDALKFQVLVTAPGFQSQVTKLINPADGKLELRMKPAADAPAERTVRGLVVDDAGRPVEGVLIDPEGGRTASRRWYGSVPNVSPTVSDEEGRFHIVLPADMSAVDLELTVNGKAGLSEKLVEPGGDEQKFTIPTGTRVTGRLMNGGKPVAGLGIAVVQLDRDSDGHFVKAVTSTTDGEGRFDFNYLPISQRYAIFTMVGEGASKDRNTVLSTKLFTAKGNNETRDLGDLQTRPGLRLRGRIELPEGWELPPGTKLSLGRDPAWDLVAIPIAADGTFDIDGLPPETYEVKVAAKAFQIDTSRVKYQVTDPQAIGLRLDRSMDDVVIPMVVK